MSDAPSLNNQKSTKSALPGHQVTFYEIRVSDTVRTLDHHTGDAIATGQVDNVVHCKNYDRILSYSLGLLARSDYPYIERKTSWPPPRLAVSAGS